MPDRLIIEAHQEGHKIEVFDSGRTQEIYADGVHGILASSGTVKVNFFTRTFPNTDADRLGVERREVTCRLVLSLDTFYSLGEFWARHIEQLKKDIAKHEATGTQP